MKSITNLFPFENYASFDAPRKLRWDNKAITQAAIYYKTTYDEFITEDDIISGAIFHNYPCVVSLLFGSLASAGDVSWPEFGRIFNPENISEYLDAVKEGIKEYMIPPGSDDDGSSLDPEWPDTQAETRKKEPKSKGFADWLWTAKSKLGLSLQEIERSSLKNIYELYWLYLEENGVNRYAESEGDENGEISY